MRVYRDIEVVDEQTGEKSIVTESVYDLMEVTYNGQDMSKRVITATIKSPDPIGFQLGDYVVLPMQSLNRDGNRGSVLAPPERYYIYTEPQCKKTARKDSTGDAFEITVNFYPRQYELSCIMMRDFIQKESNDQNIIYTGFDTVSFYGGASELLRRCKACLDQYYKDPETGKGLWNYDLDPSLNENENMALERYAFSFSGNSVMDALLKLNDKDYINTTFYINGRTIYVGKKRPYLCAVNSQGDITDSPLRMTYGKTSHMPIDIDHGGLFNITKSVGEEVPITKLFAYGAARNLNRYYCADRLHSGRFVNKLMLPSFSDDGETDYIISEESAKKYGINEGCKNFEEIYPSLRYMTYADIRGIKYCIKVRTSGLETDQFIDGKMEHTNDEGRAKIPMARVQCYKVTPCEGEKKGRNMLVECAPPEDLAIFIHATGKTVKVLLMSDDGEPVSQASAALGITSRAVERQYEHDFGHVPVRTENDLSTCIEGACFCVHDIGFVDMNGDRWSDADRQSWFEAEFRRYSDTDSLYPDNIEQQTAELHRIEYVDTFWLTDLYVMEYENGVAMYDNQRNFPRDGYSAWAWPRLNNESIYPDSMPVNEVVAVEPIVIADTSDNINAGRQQHWDIYLRDLGFAIDEQNDFGEMVFVFATPVISVLDGILAGREFTIDGGENLNNFQERVVCAYNEDGSFNYDFMFPGDSGNEGIPQRALQNGAVWRIRLNRNDKDSELSSVGLVIPNVDIHMNAGDHIVLLDIYMPDIYIRAAEQRLLREAQEYLDKNDKGNVKYSINLDQVRFNQIRNYALQMREGVRIRMQDDDLNITSQNKVRKIVEHKDVPNASEVPMYTMVNDVHEGVENTSVYTYYSKNSPNEPKFQEHFKVGPVENARVRLTVSIPKSAAIAAYDKNRPIMLMRDHIQRPYYNFEWADLIDRYSFSFDISVDDLGGSTDVYGALVVTIHELITYSEGVKEYPQEGASGVIMPAITNDYVRFKAGKYYDVVVDVHEDDVATESSDFFRPVGTHGPEGHEVNNDQIVLTPNRGSLQTNYSPVEYAKTFIKTERVDGRWLRRYKYSFYLPDSFTEGNGYYVGFYYFTPDNTGATKTDFSMVRMVSVTESDLNERGEVVNYVDFLVSNVTIKIQDNTRPADTRIMGVSPEAIYTISAQIEEQTKASAWGTLMNNVEKTRIEQEQTKRTYEAMANIARQNYQNLLNLRNNIFDPDGTCNDVFLQVMMLQVGADSMNFQLDYTFTTPTGVMNNFTVGGRDTSTPVEAYDHFKVFEDDVLHHFVYTQGAGNAGTWQIPGKFDCPLAPIITQDEQGQPVKEWPVYYVCIRCKKDSVNDLSEPAWICDTKQYSVNDETNTDYWYFNWGILTADSDGHYTLQETRGNAYMYGDNIVCGKISAIANNAYFDLTHGEFVLSESGPDSEGKYSNGITYLNNVLTIWGLNDEEGIGKAIKDLQLDIVGGENLSILEEGKYEYDGEYEGGGGMITRIIELLPTSVEEQGETIRTYLEAGKYVFSAKEIYGEWWSQYGYPEPQYQVYFYLDMIDEEGNITSVDLSQGNRIIEKVETEVASSFRVRVRTMAVSMKILKIRLDGVMLQKGTKPTEYQDYVKHLTDALHGSTEIAGGLTMTNMIMLKDEEGNVTAGMSGLPDDNPSGEFGDGTFSEGVAFYSGGTYAEALLQAKGLYSQLAQLLPVLLTKTGVHSKIGPFEVISRTAVSVKSAGGTIIIDSENGISMFDANGDIRFELTPKEIDEEDYQGYRSPMRFYDLQKYVSTSTTTDAGIDILLGVVEGSGLPSLGDYKVKVTNYATFIKVCWSKTTRTGRRGSVVHTETGTIFDPIDFTYQIQLVSHSTGVRYPLCSAARITINNGFATITADSETTIQDLPAGLYYVYLRFTAQSTDFLKYPSHYYEIYSRPGMEVIALDDAEMPGKVVIGTNGLLVTAGNSTMILAKTVKNNDSLDVKMLGLPDAAVSGNLPTGQMYLHNGTVCVKLSQ